MKIPNVKSLAPRAIELGKKVASEAQKGAGVVKDFAVNEFKGTKSLIKDTVDFAKANPKKTLLLSSAAVAASTVIGAVASVAKNAIAGRNED